MSKITFNLVLPPWLAQWFVHRCGGTMPVKLPKGSVESVLVQRFTVPKSYAEDPDVTGMSGAVVIEIPENKAKPAETYSHLPVKAKKLLAKSISDNFNLCLAHDIVRPAFPLSLKRELIETWMEQNGIEYTSTNWEGVEKRFTRLRADMLTAQRVKKARKKHRNY